MKTLAESSLILIMCALALSVVCAVKAQDAGSNVTNFFNSEMPGLKIQANATTETRPGGTLTVWLSITPQPQTNVHVDSFRLDVYGFLNGTERVSIGNVNDSNLPNSAPSDYNETFTVPDGVAGVTFGEITLAYSISLGALDLTFPSAVSGFHMTHVKDTVLENLQDQLKTLNSSYTQLNSDYSNLTSAYHQLNQNYLQLKQNYTSLQGSMGELSGTRSVAVVLAITTVLFVITTVFMVMRRPKESW